MTQSYPLHWPAGRPRRHSSKRAATGQFRHAGSAITIAAACDRLIDEVEKLGGSNLIISTNVEPTLSGRPRSGKAAPADPGVAVYFAMGGDPVTLACDRYSDVAQNLAALAAHIEATRKIERYGVQKAKEALRAFLALPASGPPWWQVLGVSPDASEVDIERAYREKAKRAHPDAGGSEAAMTELNAARDAARRARAA